LNVKPQRIILRSNDAIGLLGVEDDKVWLSLKRVVKGNNCGHDVFHVIKDHHFLLVKEENFRLLLF